MKTAMQELIEYLEKVYYVKEIIDWDEYKKELLEKEKEQICNSYVEGLEGLYMGAEEYYNQEYGQAGRTFTQDLIPKN
jgi:hypothetical protein